MGMKAQGHSHIYLLLKFLSLLVIGPFSLSAFSNPQECVEGWTNIPPYYSYTPSPVEQEHFFLYGKVTKTGEKKRAPATVGKIFDGHPENSNYKLIKKNTLVKPVVPLNENYNPDDLVLVNIIGESESSKYLLGITGVEAGDKEKELSFKGEKGFISPHTLAPSSSSDVLFVTKDTFILGAGGGLDEMVVKYGEGLKPITQDNMYKVMNCGDKFTYLFQLISTDEERNNKEIKIDNVSCIDNQLINEPAFKDIQALMKKLEVEKPEAPKIEVNEWGLSRLQEDPTGGYTHFTGPDPVGTDDWAKPDTLCSLMDIADEWKKNCVGKGCTLQIGDIGFPTPAVLENGRDPLGHLQHSDGSCIDMRPFRKDRKMEGVNLKHSLKDYDAVRTNQFISFLISKGATPIYFNDPNIVNSSNPNRKRKSCDLENPKNDEKQGVFNCEGHSDHIHFCLRKPFVKGC
jgi:hypothetical protein